MDNKLFNDDCFNVFEKMDKDTVDMVLVDLPYGQTDCDWDIQIDLNKMWKELKRICKGKCQFVFFTTTKYGIELINSNKRYFKYDLVWEKHLAVGFLSCNKMPLRSHEMIYIFNNGNIDDINIEFNLELREYAKKVLKFIGKTSKQIERELGHRKAEHFLQRVSTSQFSLPTNKTYNELIYKYNINEMEGFIQYEDLRSEKISSSSIYNPQKTKGKPYKVSDGKRIKGGVYGDKITRSKRDDTNTNERFPRSVLKYHQDGEKLHPTQKPLELCEWLIKTYSNEGDLVLDFCMGSGTTPLACKKTNRRYIGVEKEKDIFKTAEARLNE
jgi:site-specific DNA-methyltransferase (adenine-specific)